MSEGVSSYVRGRVRGRVTIVIDSFLLSLHLRLAKPCRYKKKVVM